jgi:hypothetical protein
VLLGEAEQIERAITYLKKQPGKTSQLIDTSRAESPD